MHHWEPILDGGLLEKASAVQQQIRKLFLRNMETPSNISLARGLTGQLLFMSWCFPSDYNPDKHLEKIFSAIAGDTFPVRNFMGGFAGTAYTLQLINQKHQVLDDSVLDDFYTYIRKFIIMDVYHSDFDLINGYMGQCYTLLQQPRSEQNLEVLQAAVKNLASVAIRSENGGIGWLSKVELKIHFPELESLQQPPCVWNLGMAHGITGIIITLTRIAAVYPELQLNHLIADALRGLQSTEVIPDNLQTDYYYSFFSGIERRESKPGQLSWCHSDLGIGYMYYMLWEMTGYKAHREKADKLFRACVEKDVDQSAVKSCGLCHGAAGVAHLFNRIYQKTKEPIYKERAIYWYNLLLNDFLTISNDEHIIRGHNYNKFKGVQYYTDDGFIEGLAGVGLAVHAACNPEFPHWDSLLMLQ